MANKNTTPLAMGRMQKGSAVNKKKKKDEEERKTVAQRKPQSSSVSKPTQQQRQNQKSYGTTQPKVTQKQPTPRARTSTQQRSVDPKETRRQESARTMRSAARSFASEDRRTAAQAQKMNMPTAEEQRKARMKDEERRIQAQKIKSGIYEDKDTKLSKWDRDISDTVKSTLKQTVAEDKKFLNESMKGITLKDRGLYASDEQIKKADKKVAERDKKYTKQIEQEGKNLEEIQNRHGYLGKQALSAVSSATGMATDIATGVPLAHMFMRSTAGAQGQVKKKADNLRKQLESTGQYTPDELDEMFKDVDALDMANATASGGIEVLSEKLFAGFGPVARYVGGSSIADKVASKFLNKAGGKATSGLLKSALKGTGEEIAEEEIGGPLQALAGNLIYGNKFQQYNEDAVKRSLADQSNALRSQVHSEEEARLTAARLSSDEFMQESIKTYMDSGESEEDARELAELSRDYLTAALSGDVDSMKQYQDAMVDKLAGGDKSLKEKFTFQDAIDAAVSTSMMTLATGVPGAINTMQAGNSYKESAGLDAIKQQAEMIKNWGEGRETSQAQAVMDHIDDGGDVSGTQAYEIIQRAGELAQENKKSEYTRDRVAQTEMRKNDLRISPMNPDGTLAPQTEQRYSQIVDSTVSRYASLAKIGEESGIETEDIELGADIGAAFETGVISAEQINELARGSAAVQTIFQDVTGININQFGTYTEMRDSLMAKAADNLVNSARLEQVTWNDEARGSMAQSIARNIGVSGNEAVLKAFMDVDPRDQGKFMLTGEAASRVYSYARHTEGDWGEAKNTFKEMFKGTDENALRAVFAAAKEDKQVEETEYWGHAVKEGERLSQHSEGPVQVQGEVLNSENLPMGAEDQLFLQSWAKAFHVNYDVVSTLPVNIRTRSGEIKEGQAEGSFRPATNTLTVNINEDITKPIQKTIMHELSHSAIYAPDEMLDLLKYIRDAWYRKDPEGYTSAVSDVQNRYSGEQSLSELEALEELMADGAADFEFWNDTDLAERMANENPTLAQKVLNVIRDVLRKIRSILASGNIRNKEYSDAVFAYAVDMSTAEALYLRAINASKKVKAQQAIDEWQDRANGEARYSITPEQDAEYMSAVESGDMKTAQRMVDDAAARSMPRTKLTGRWYHGTENEFTEFNFSQGGKNGHADGYGIYLTNDPEVASSYGSRMIEGYVNVERPASALTSQTLTKAELHRLIKRTVDNEAETLQSEGYDSVDQAKFDTWISNYTDTYHAGSIDKAIDEVIDAITNINGNDYDIVLEIMTGMGIRDYEEASAFYDILTEETGIDGFETKWGDESEMADPNTPTIALAFRSEQIKDAAPVTYDDEGNAIPLSERFNLNNPDIRYSFTTDKDDYIKGGQIPKELKQWAKDIGLDSISKQPTRGPVIVSVKDLRSAWMQKNGRNDEAEVINEVLDTIGRSLTNTIGKYNYIDLSNSVNATVHYRTNKDGKPTSVILSCQVQNAEYEVNFDFTTICSKRKAMQKVLERFIKTEGEQKSTLYDELKLDEEGMYKLRLILEKAGFEVSCKGCFVEQNRYSQQKQAKTIADDWNKALDDWAKENGTEVTDNFDLVNLDINSLDYDEINEAFARYSELIKTKPKKDVATKNRTLIEAHPFFRKRMNPSDYASVDGQRALMAIGSTGGTNLYGLLKRGQSDSKQSVPFTAYNGEVSLLPDNMKGKTLYDYLMSIGGARAQSASDFQIENFYDYMQLVADLSARGLPMHMYTKVIECAELFGMTGIKINLSAMCDVDESLDGEYAGLKLVDGKYEYNISDQSIDYPKAVELQKKPGYSKNIGIIMVTLSKQHMLKSLDDNDVRYIIGYHSSAMPVVVAQMTNMGNATDYTKINKTNKLNEKGRALFAKAMEQAEGETDLAKYKDALRIFDDMIQEEVAADKRKVPRRGNEYARYMSAYGSNTADFNTYEDLSKSGDARKTADNYIEWCMNNDLIPIYFPFAFHDNYYKCEIYDFNMYDNVDGNYAPMGSVQNIYPGLDMTKGETDTTKFMGRVTEMMDEQNTINEALDSQYDNVFDEAKNELRFSITGDEYIDFDEADIDRTQLTPRADAMKTEEQMRDEAYMDAVNSGNMEEAQRLVNEAAERAGYRTKAYHGTPSYGFTEFDIVRRINGRAFGDGIYLTNIREAAEPYASERKEFDAETKSLVSMGQPGIYSLFVKTGDDALDFDYENFTYNGRKVGPAGRMAMIQMDIEANPNKDVIVRNINDGSDVKSTVYVIKDAGRVKSSDAVTYADDGSVIPLSQRFDPTNNDIRYSLPTQDADGKVLTNGQMEYFKNSMARDAQGRLVPVYHGTFRGPRITVFNESSDGIWFTSDRSIAEDYSMGYEMGIPGALYGDERNPYDTDDEYFAKKGIRIEQNSNGDWVAAINRNGREHYWGGAETKDELIDSLYESNENEELFDSQFTLRDVYPVYLNLENPKIIECNGSMHDDVNGTGMTTRELAAEAMAEGYDGIIFRNIVDPFEPMDVYVAFSSNQIKDINNENPTENPDIRYSITPEDEGMSKLAYEDAMDDSYEALARYEEMLDDPNAEQYFSRPFKEEDVTKFFDSLRAEDAVPSADPSFEEDRVRRAKSKAEFYNSVNAKWNDRWTTEGEVLDLKSVKKDIKNLVMGVMANSDTDAQYRNKLVRQTLLDVRTAYQLMKQDRTDVASYLLFHSAQRMIEGVEFIQDDTAFQEYKEIRDYLRTYRITAPEEFWENESFLEFRKEYYGRLRIGKGNSNIEDVYKDLEDRWPHLFNETERENADLKDKPWDLLQHIGVVVDSNVTPFMEAYSSEEAMAVITETADALYDIMAGGKEVVSLADSYKQRFDEKTKAMKQRHAEAILRERKIREEGIQKERQKYREWKQRDREKRKERQAHKTYFDRIKDTHDKLVERLTSNTADKHIPEQYKKELAKLLAAFDLQTEGSKAREARTGHVAQKTIKMAAIRSALKNIEDRSELFHVNDAVTDIMDSLSVVDGQTIDSLSAAELSNIDKLLRALLHEFNRYEKVKIGVKNMQAADLASAQTVSALEHAKLFGPGNDYYGAIGWLDRIINMDEVTPAYMFRRIDPDNTGLGLMWKEIRRSQDRYIRNTDQIQKWMDEITGKYKNKGRFNKKYGSDTIEQWRSTNYQQTFDVTNGSVTLTPAQAMSLYCLSKRNQAYGHMVGAGIVVAPVSFQAKLMSDLKRKINRSMPVILTDADIKTIVSSLTPEQIKVADQLQELMSTKMADMGNEASMNVLGIKLFNERDYFPIKSDKAALERDLSNEEFESAIRNFGFTKAVQPGARNAIMVEDIFDVVAEHCNNMNLYNAYSETLNDFMKVFNKHTIMEDGADYSVRQALAHAYSNKVPTYIMEFIRDINGNVSKGRQTGIDNAMSDMLGRAKQASVFANIRVLLQQPTAITRAFAVIDPKYLKGVSMKDVAKGSIPTVTTEVMQEMFEHCPIALWKSWGYYDINMGRSIEAVIMNEGNFLEDLATQAYGKADNVTWAAIWQMVKEEAKDLHPELKEGTSEFFEHCNERMSEIVDLTQVVDSPLHRSHLMRSKQVHHKILTAFMSEPTLTFNMLYDGLIRAREAWKKGNKAESSRIIGRIGGVAVLQATTVAAAAAIADALRGKGGDDDDDKGFGELWLLNFIENLKDEAKVWNKIYYVKDLASIAEGWDNANLALQGWKSLCDGFRQLDKKLFEGSKTPWWKIYYNLLGGLGYFTGIPFKTLMKDGRSIFEMLGGELPESLVGEEKTSGVISSDSKLNSLRLFNSSDSDSSVSSIVRVDTGDKWYDYENNPITVRDGSTLDKILNHFGINLTASEKAAVAASQLQKTRDKTAEEIRGKYANLSGEERDKKVWSAVTTYFKGETEDSKAFADMVTSGDYASISDMRRVYLAAGGEAEYFDERVLAESKKALKKTIKYGQTAGEIEAQANIQGYLTSHGMTDDEVSDIIYKSDVAKDMKVAFRLGDKDLMLESLEPLVNAGLTYNDLVRLWDNRNRMDLTKYKGRYKDKLKSTGNFIWPTEGVITSHFGYRNAPTAGASSNHPAIDIGAPQGTAVVAADGGTVIYAGRNSGYGNSVGIKHDNGMVTYYNHLYSWNVKVGDTVGQGQQIAQVGSTGISTGPHLDFKILDVNGEPVDPEQYLSKKQ